MATSSITMGLDGAVNGSNRRRVHIEINGYDMTDHADIYWVPNGRKSYFEQNGLPIGTTWESLRDFLQHTYADYTPIGN